LIVFITWKKKSGIPNRPRKHDIFLKYSSPKTNIIVLHTIENPQEDT